MLQSNSSKGYVLFWYSFKGNKQYLAKNMQFYIATNQALKFSSKHAAKAWIDKNWNLWPIATQVFIEGPKRGIYSLNEVK